MSTGGREQRGVPGLVRDLCRAALPREASESAIKRAHARAFELLLAFDDLDGDVARASDDRMHRILAALLYAWQRAGRGATVANVRAELRGDLPGAAVALLVALAPATPSAVAPLSEAAALLRPLPDATGKNAAATVFRPGPLADLFRPRTETPVVVAAAAGHPPAAVEPPAAGPTLPRPGALLDLDAWTHFDRWYQAHFWHSLQLHLRGIRGPAVLSEAHVATQGAAAARGLASEVVRPGPGGKLVPAACARPPSVSRGATRSVLSALAAVGDAWRRCEKALGRLGGTPEARAVAEEGRHVVDEAQTATGADAPSTLMEALASAPVCAVAAESLALVLEAAARARDDAVDLVETLYACTVAAEAEPGHDQRARCVRLLAASLRPWALRLEAYVLGEKGATHPRMPGFLHLGREVAFLGDAREALPLGVGVGGGGGGGAGIRAPALGLYYTPTDMQALDARVAALVAELRGRARSRAEARGRADRARDAAASLAKREAAAALAQTQARDTARKDERSARRRARAEALRAQLDAQTEEKARRDAATAAEGKALEATSLPLADGSAVLPPAEYHRLKAEARAEVLEQHARRMAVLDGRLRDATGEGGAPAEEAVREMAMQDGDKRMEGPMMADETVVDQDNHEEEEMPMEAVDAVVEAAVEVVETAGETAVEEEHHEMQEVAVEHVDAVVVHMELAEMAVMEAAEVVEGVDEDVPAVINGRIDGRVRGTGDTYAGGTVSEQARPTTVAPDENFRPHDSRQEPERTTTPCATAAVDFFRHPQGTVTVDHSAVSTFLHRGIVRPVSILARAVDEEAGDVVRHVRALPCPPGSRPVPMAPPAGSR